MLSNNFISKDSSMASPFYLERKKEAFSSLCFKRITCSECNIQLAIAIKKAEHHSAFLLLILKLLLELVCFSF